MAAEQEVVDEASKADVVLAASMAELRNLHSEDKFFFLLATDFGNMRKEQPRNVFILDGEKLFSDEHGVAAAKRSFERWSEERSRENEPYPIEVPKDIVKFSRGYAVLIVDDSQANLTLAMQVLPGQQIALVTSVGDALRLLRLKGKTFNAVLTDMHMPPDAFYGSLNLDSYGIKETVPCGFAIMLEATQRGIPVAVVTDANHHQDWVSAMFDHIREATVNGQKVLFFNNIGKRWDRALQCLLEG